MGKVMLKDLLGKKDLNILVDISIKGQKFDHDSPVNERVLEKVYKKKIKGEEWLYIEWTKEGKIKSINDSTFNDCGYSGVKLGERHELDKLYLNVM